MAEEDEGGRPGGESAAKFLTRKVGPFPLWLYAVGFAGIWYYLQRRGSSSSSSSTTTGTTGSSSSYGTDPAGNTGVIDPSTGYVAGSAEDTAALEQSSSSSSTSTTYSTNDAWANAAINYLVALGEDATVSNSAIEAYLGSQTLTTAQQAMVNQAIQALGAPPQPPSPSTTTTVVTAPGGATTYATNPPTGLTVSATSGNSITLKWNAAANAKGYTVTATPTSGSAVTTSVSTPLATLTGLQASTSYKVTVQATPADAGAASASTTAKTSLMVKGTPSGTGTVGSTGDVPLKAGEEIYVAVNIVSPDTMQKEATKHGISLAHLIQQNPGSSASTTGVVWVPYLVKSGDTLDSIAKTFAISPEHLSSELQSEGVV